MSAFMVSKTHIDLMVRLAIWGPSGVEVRPDKAWYRPYFGNPSRKAEPETANELGEIFVKENLSSIHYRYPDTIENPDATPGPIEQYWLTEYEYDDPQIDLTIVEDFCLLDCYEYQSCEHPEWRDSEAFKLVDSIRGSLIHRLPGYDQVPWSFDRDDLAKLRKAPWGARNVQ